MCVLSVCLRFRPFMPVSLANNSHQREIIAKGIV